MRWGEQEINPNQLWIVSTVDGVSTVKIVEVRFGNRTVTVVLLNCWEITDVHGQNCWGPIRESNRYGRIIKLLRDHGRIRELYAIVGVRSGNRTVKVELINYWEITVELNCTVITVKLLNCTRSNSWFWSRLKYCIGHDRMNLVCCGNLIYAAPAESIKLSYRSNDTIGLVL